MHSNSTWFDLPLRAIETFLRKRYMKKIQASFNFKVNILMKSHYFIECCSFKWRFQHASQLQQPSRPSTCFVVDERDVLFFLFSISFDTRPHVCQTLGTRMNRTIAAIWINFEFPLFS